MLAVHRASLCISIEVIFADSIMRYVLMISLLHILIYLQVNNIF